MWSGEGRRGSGEGGTHQEAFCSPENKSKHMYVVIIIMLIIIIIYMNLCVLCLCVFLNNFDDIV